MRRWPGQSPDLFGALGAIIWPFTSEYRDMIATLLCLQGSPGLLKPWLSLLPQASRFAIIDGLQ